MNKLIVVLASFLVYTSATAQHVEKWKISDVEKYMAVKNGDVLVINFWATFCKPCVAEIPSFIKTVEKHKEAPVKLLLVSLDLPSYFPKKISNFAQKNDFDAKIVWLDESNADYFCPRIDGKWSGSIPATIIINTKTGYKRFFEEEIEQDVFEKALVDVISNTTGK
ncbi:MAG: TlpA disulfide reductase family protein [Ferruginibacter sp.]